MMPRIETAFEVNGQWYMVDTSLFLAVEKCNGERRTNRRIVGVLDAAVGITVRRRKNGNFITYRWMNKETPK